MKYKYLFGPVNSRRLGISLGVDLFADKTCTMNCVYCEVGSTIQTTDLRSEYVPLTDIKAELDAFILENPRLDFITFSGNGEPTLYSRLGDLVQYLKTRYPQYKICLITNSTQLNHPEVITQIVDVDVMLPSLDAVSEDIFIRINRPHTGITASSIITGLLKLRREFHGQLWLEVFIVPGVNDTDLELQKFREVISRIQPDQVQINSLDRPGPVDWVKPASLSDLQKIESYFRFTPEELQNMQYKTTISIIARPKQTNQATEIAADKKDQVLQMISRRPSTLEDICTSVSMTSSEAEALLQDMLVRKEIIKLSQTRGDFYCLDKDHKEDLV